jgi:hypothetical protein
MIYNTRKRVTRKISASCFGFCFIDVAYEDEVYYLLVNAIFAIGLSYHVTTRTNHHPSFVENNHNSLSHARDVIDAIFVIFM